LDKIKSYQLDFNNFQLPFLSEPGYVLEQGTRDIDVMLYETPKNALLLGRNRYTVDNWRSWDADDLYFILPLENDYWDYSLFRITWDDNYTCWAWTSDCRIKGEFKSIKEAALIMLSESWEKWEIDILTPENNEYKKLYNKIKRSKF
jgi:hypothetical protein